MTKAHKIYLASFTLPMLIVLLSWMINGFFPFGSKSLMAVDFNAQYIGLYAYMRRVFLTGDWHSIWYSFSKSIGGGMLGIWGFNLLSPFNIIYFFFSQEQFQWAVGLTILLRYGAMGVSWTYFFVKRYEGLSHRLLALPIFASIYALNGFNVSYQMNPIFYDGMILLPLVLVGLEEVLDQLSAKRYIALLALTLFLHYYMGYMICIFIGIYALFYMFQSKQYRSFQDYVQGLFCLAKVSFLAVGMVAFLLVPILLSLLGTKGGLESRLLFEWKLQIDPLDLFSKLFLGAFDNTSWPAGPNLPNIYVSSIGLIGSLYYFMSDAISSSHKRAAAFVIVVFGISCVHEFTNKLWHMGQNPAGFFYRFSWIIAFFLVYLAYLSLRDLETIAWRKLVYLCTLLALISLIVFQRSYSFLWIPQKLATVTVFLMIVTLFMSSIPVKRWSILALITAVELTVNTTIVQSRVGYTDAYKYQDAVAQLKEAIEPIRPTQKDFYRINASFNLSKNDPFMANYPGMSTFSSNLENHSRKLFEQLGNTGINATTYYYGTPLTDALFGVKYLLVPKPVYTKDYPDSSKLYVFGRNVTRFDITRQTPVVYETKRTEIYQTPQILPIAFGVNEQVAHLTLLNHQPLQNQNRIMETVLQTNETYLEALAPNEIIVDNLEFNEKQGTYRRMDSTKPATMTYRLIPQTNEAYWVSLPQRFSRSDHAAIKIWLNESEYEFLDRFQATQLLQIAANDSGHVIDFKIEILNDDPYSFSNILFARSNHELVDRLIQERLAQSMHLTHWDNSHLQGNVSITDNSSVMFTSIPYDKGWKIKVDGKPVASMKIWNSLLGFPIEAGDHSIELRFVPEGFILGSWITVVSCVIVGVGLKKKWF